MQIWGNGDMFAGMSRGSLLGMMAPFVGCYSVFNAASAHV